MEYKITNKVNGNSEYTSKIELIKLIDGFIAWNRPRKILMTAADKIAYYNRKSFYQVSEVK